MLGCHCCHCIFPAYSQSQSFHHTSDILMTYRQPIRIQIRHRLIKMANGTSQPVSHVSHVAIWFLKIINLFIYAMPRAVIGCLYSCQFMLWIVGGQLEPLHNKLKPNYSWYNAAFWPFCHEISTYTLFLWRLIIGWNYCCWFCDDNSASLWKQTTTTTLSVNAGKLKYFLNVFF